MKKIIPFLLLAAGCSAQSWVQLNSGTATNLRDVFFTSPDTGFVVGEDSTLLKTTDGGLTWTHMSNVPSASPGNLNGIWMFSSGAGFAAPEFFLSIPQTGNGGASWTASPTSSVGNPCYPDGVFFDGLNEGFLYGGGCFGGAYLAHWNGTAWDAEHQLDYTSTPFDPYVGITGVAKDPDGPSYVALGDYGKIFRSTDAFQTWDTIAYGDTTYFSAVDYAGNHTFYASSPAIINSIYISTDSGKTWAYDMNSMPTFYYSGFYDIDMLDNGFGVAVGFSQTTTRGFVQWRTQSQGWTNYEPIDHILRGVYVVDSTLAFAVGDSGAIYRYGTPPLGIKAVNNADATLKVYPSPMRPLQVFSVELPETGSWDLDVFDAQGEAVVHYNRLKGKLNMVLPVGPGIYLMRATSGSKVMTTRLLVQ